MKGLIELHCYNSCTSSSMSLSVRWRSSSASGAPVAHGRLGLTSVGHLRVKQIKMVKTAPTQSTITIQAITSSALWWKCSFSRCSWKCCPGLGPILSVYMALSRSSNSCNVSMLVVEWCPPSSRTPSVVVLTSAGPSWKGILWWVLDATWWPSLECACPSAAVYNTTTCECIAADFKS